MANWNDEMDVLNLDELLREEDGPAPAAAADGPETEASSRAADRRGEAVSSDPAAPSQQDSRPARRPGEKRARRPEPRIEDTSALQLEFLDLEGDPEGPYGEPFDAEPEDDDFGGDFFGESVREKRRRGAEGGRGRRMPQNRDLHDERSGARAGRRSLKKDRRADDAADRTRGGGIPIHLILPVVIVLVAAVAVIRLIIWNAGVDVDIDAEANANRFNVEVNDSMVSVSSADLEGAADDDVTTVLCLGNEPFSLDTSETGLAGQIAALGDCSVINAAFPDSQVTCENETYTTDTLEDMDDIFNLFYVAYAISIDDYTSLETVASVHEDTYKNAVSALQSTDFSSVDIIAIMYDGIDYVNGMAMYNEEVPEELTTYVGSLSNSIELLREAYPHIRIVFLSPYYAEYDSGSARTTDLGNGTIVDYYQWAYDTCGSEGISFLDNYYGSINENNFEEYLSSDMTLNAAGATKIADHFVYKVIQGNYSEYNPEELAVAQ